MRSLHSQSATVNLASGATVLSHTVTTATALADLVIEVGNGTNNLAAAAETTLTVAITVAGVPVRGIDPTETVQVGRTRLRIPVDTFPVATGEAVAVTLTSDKAADTAVAVTATLRDASPLQPVTRGRQVKADADGLVELTSESTELVANATKTLLGTGTLVPVNVTQVNGEAAAAAAEPIDAALTTASEASVAAAVKTKIEEAGSSIATIYDRVGAWTGSGRNTILGAFQALFRSDADATVPSDVNADLGSGVGDADNTTDSTEAIRDQGDTAWTSSGSVYGATLRTITFTATDDASAVVSGVKIAILSADESTTRKVVTTGVAGTAVANLEDDSYVLRISPPLAYDAVADIALTVAADAAQAISLTGSSVTAADVTKCLVRCRVFNAAGVALSGAIVKAVPVSTSASISTALLAAVAASDTTDADGYAELELPRSSEFSSGGSHRYKFTITYDGASVFKEVEREIPDSASTWLEVMLNTTV